MGDSAVRRKHPKHTQEKRMEESRRSFRHLCTFKADSQAKEMSHPLFLFALFNENTPVWF